MPTATEVTSIPMPPPSPELWGRFSDMVYLAQKKPKEFEARVRSAERLIEAHRTNSGIMRLRNAEYDREVERTREEWANWLTASAAAIRIAAGL